MPNIDNLYKTDDLRKDQGFSYDLEMGNLLYNGGNFKKSLPYLKKALPELLKTKNFSAYFFCYSQMIQALNELQEIEAAKELDKEVKEACLKYNLPATPSSLACSAYYNIYVEKNMEKARDQLNSALKTAFDYNDKYIKSGDRFQQNAIRYEIMFCLYNYIIYYMGVEDFNSCVQELSNLKILIADYLKLKEEVELDHTRTENAQELQTYNKILNGLKKDFQKVQKIQLSTKLVEAVLEIQYRKNYNKANKLLWELYEEANKTNHTFLIPYILAQMSWCYVKLKNKPQAQMFYNLAQKNLSPDRKLLNLYLKTLRDRGQLNLSKENEVYDLIFDVKDHIVIEKQKGCIELKNQFILMDLLKLFLLNPGTSYSKETIIKKIWKQDYLPEVHDNKIYVTIKRLREMIEINSCKPLYIKRNSTGYHFSKQARVLVKQ